MMSNLIITMILNIK